MERLLRLEQLGLQREDPLADAEAALQLARIERFPDVVVGARFQAGDEVAPLLPRGKEQEPGVGTLRAGPHDAADFGAVEAGHHPIEHRQARRRTLAEERIERLLAVVDDLDVVAPSGQRRLQRAPGNGVVVGDEYDHRAPSSSQREASSTLGPSSAPATLRQWRAAGPLQGLRKRPAPRALRRATGAGIRPGRARRG